MKIGFACMRHETIQNQKLSTTTLTALRRLDKREAREKLVKLAARNGKAVYNLVCSVASEHPYLRMVRIGTNVWPFYDHVDYGPYEVSNSIKWLNKAREVAERHNVRLSFHPDQFNALGSDRKEVVDQTVRTLSVVGVISEHLGATEIVLHCWGRGGVKAFRSNMAYLPDNVFNRLVVENDEFGVGTEPLLTLERPIVLDAHHHWVNTGEWPEIELFEACANTWHDRVPKIHYSYPRNDESRIGFPQLDGSRTAARVHSDSFYNRTVSEYILRVAGQIGADIMVEAKHKDKARNKLFKLYNLLGLGDSNEAHCS